MKPAQYQLRKQALMRGLPLITAIMFLGCTQSALGQWAASPSPSPNNNIYYNSGNVGIGTNNPVYKLTLQQDSTTSQQLALQNDTASAGRYSEILFTHSNGAGKAGIRGYAVNLGSNNESQLRFFTSPSSNSPTERMTIDQAGNVGIGTTSPGNKLDVSGNVSVRDLVGTGTQSLLYGYLNGAGRMIADLYSKDQVGVLDLSIGNGSIGTRISGYGHSYFNGGNVGIGTTSPDSPLHVTNGPTMTGGWNRSVHLQATYPVVVFNSSASRWAGIGYDYSSALRFWVNATSNDVPATGLVAMNILNSGNVGIGTGNPYTKLHVSGGDISVDANQGIRKAGDNWIIGYSNSLPGIAIGSGSASDQVSINSGGFERFRILTNGNVGIGTNAPGYKLDVNGEINATGLRINGTSLSGSQWTGSGSISYSGGNVGIGTTNPAKPLTIQASSGANAIAINGRSDDYGYLEFFRNNGTTLSGSIYSKTDRVTITDANASDVLTVKAGNVGIGTTSPLAKFHSEGPAGSYTGYFHGNSASSQSLGVLIDAGTNTSDYSFRVRSYGSTDFFAVRGDGNVGVGTTSPLATLTVVGNGSYGADTVNSGITITNATTSAERLHIGVDNSIGANGAAYLQSMRSGTTYTSLLLNPTNGNVGVGTITPGYKLDVAGQIRSSTGGFMFPDGTVQTTAASGSGSQWSGSGPIYYTGGNVGIGTSNPSDSLHVSNVVRISPFSPNSAGSYLNAGATLRLINGNIYQQGGSEISSIQFGGMYNSGGVQVDSVYNYIDWSNGSLRVRNNQQTKIQVGGGDEWSSQNIYFNPSGGNVGIGTTSPDSPLHVANGPAMTSGWNRSVNLQATYPVVVFNSSASRWAGIGYDYSSAMRFWVNATSNDVPATGVVAMNILNSGNVGIGTNAPGYKLDVNGEINATGLRINNTPISTSQWSGSSSISYSGNVGIGTTNPAKPLTIQASSTANAIAINGRSDDYGYLEFFRNNGTTLSGSIYSQTDRVTITDANASDVLTVKAGNVGIGTTSPGKKLDVSGNISVRDLVGTGTQSLLYGYLDGAGRMIADLYSRDQVGVLDLSLGDGTVSSRINGSGHSFFNGGNVGIGTTSPDSPLHVTNGPAMTGGWNRSLNLQAAYPVAVFNSNASKWGGIGYDHSTSMRFWVNATSNDVPGTGLNAMTILNDGNVGIGTGNPSTRLHVSGGDISVDAGQGIRKNGDNWIVGYSNSLPGITIGSGTASDQVAISSGGLERFRILTNGNVGVGKHDPGYKLDVNGEINATGLLINGTPFSGSQWTGSGSISYSGGNVGIGTTSPGKPLTIQASSGANAIAINGRSDDYGYLEFFRNNGTTLSGSIYSKTDRVTITDANASDVLTVKAGSVGISTTNPADGYKLDVNGKTNVTGNLNIAAGNGEPGNIVAAGTIFAKYQDVAEWVPSSEQLAAGTVVVLDSTKSNQVTSSSKPYDTRVAGVVSAQPGIALGEKSDSKVLVATTGRVKVKVDASKGPIHIGDLLVTSDVLGVAMKSQEIDLGGVKIHRPGTLIGKALEPLTTGKGEILVLLSLQ